MVLDSPERTSRASTENMLGMGMRYLISDFGWKKRDGSTLSSDCKGKEGGTLFLFKKF